MRIIICCLLTALSFGSVFAQSLERFVIGSAGMYTENDSMAFDMTVGEAVTASLQSGTIILLQGFHKGGEGMTTSIDPQEVAMDYSLYPNPTTDRIFLQLTAEKAVSIQIRLLDIQGKQTDIPVQQYDRLRQLRTEMNLAHLPAGIYVLQIASEEQGPLKSFRIAKQ
ncbi:MAG: T9SS type A sorting domain-containing protein [Bacteroidota bacterium]